MAGKPSEANNAKADDADEAIEAYEANQAKADDADEANGPII